MFFSIQLRQNQYENIYESYIRRVLERVQILRIKTLKDCVNNCFRKDYGDQIESALLSMQRRGRILLSSDGWCLTKGAYKRFTNITRDYFNDKVDYTSSFRLSDTSFLEYGEYDRDIADCMVVVADMHPDSRDFVIGHMPWLVQFVTPYHEDSPSRLYQITKIKSGEELAYGTLMSQLPVMEDEDVLDAIYRIAVLENPESAYLVPKLGFIHIVQINENEPSGYTIIESRSPEYRWKDYVHIRERNNC